MHINFHCDLETENVIFYCEYIGILRQMSHYSLRRAYLNYMSIFIIAPQNQHCYVVQTWEYQRSGDYLHVLFLKSKILFNMLPNIAASVYAFIWTSLPMSVMSFRISGGSEQNAIFVAINLLNKVMLVALTQPCNYSFCSHSERNGLQAKVRATNS